MKEMSNIFAGIGAIIFTSKLFYYFSNTFNSLFTITLAFTMLQPFIFKEENDDSSSSSSVWENLLGHCPQSVKSTTKTIAIWTMLTCLVSALSLISFSRFAKGSTLSVAGKLAYVLNSIQMLVLFSWAQVLCFTEKNWQCWRSDDSAKLATSAFVL